jgi:hemerythrin-like domain-containing protein
MRPTEILRREHEQIQKALAALVAVAERAEAGESVARTEVDQLLDFFRRFADRCHHAKEENALFPALEARGFPPRGGPVAVMMHEHELGRALLRSIEEATPGCNGDVAARARFAGAARSYESLLVAHIHKENQILFPMAERVLDDEADTRILALFTRIDRDELGPGERDRLLAGLTHAPAA